MSTTIDRRVSALEQAAGDMHQRLFLVVTFPGSEEDSTGLYPLSGSSPPVIDRLPGENWGDLRARANRATEHLAMVIYIARSEGEK